MCKWVSVTVNAQAGSQTCVFATNWRTKSDVDFVIFQKSSLNYVRKNPRFKINFWLNFEYRFFFCDFLCIGHILDSISSFSSWLALWMALIAYHTFLMHEFGVFGIWYDVQMKCAYEVFSALYVIVIALNAFWNLMENCSLNKKHWPLKRMKIILE